MATGDYYSEEKRGKLKDALYDHELESFNDSTGLHYIPSITEREFEELLQEKDDSSFNDDMIPPSEDDFFSSEWEEENAETYAPPLTRRKKALIEKLNANKFEEGDGNETNDEKQYNRVAAVEEFQKHLLKKRSVKSYKRLKAVRDMNLKSPNKEAYYLEKMELADKKLNKPYYYEKNEPFTYKTLLLKRKKAITRKYELYAMDSAFRRDFEDKVMQVVEHLEPDGASVATSLSYAAVRSAETETLYHESEEENPSTLRGDTESENSSFYDLNVPTSEHELFSSEFEQENLSFSKHNSNTIKKYNKLLKSCKPLKSDNSQEKLMKFMKMVDVKAQFKNFIEKKKALKALARIKTVSDMDLKNPKLEAEQLLHMEIIDKKLNKQFYYSNTEPHIYKKLLAKRRKAIMKKYERYVKDPDFREHVKSKAYVDVYRIQPSPLFESGNSSSQNMDYEQIRSSFNDSEIPTSEQQFMSDAPVEIPAMFERPRSRTKKALDEQLEHCEIDNSKDSFETMAKKRQERLDTIVNHKQNLSECRRQKAAQRLEYVTKLGLSDPKQKAKHLEEMELADKRLDRNYYYTPGEPKAFNKLLNKRRRAIHRKYELYARESYFQKDFEKRATNGQRIARASVLADVSSTSCESTNIFGISSSNGQPPANDPRQRLKRPSYNMKGAYPKYTTKTFPIRKESMNEVEQANNNVGLDRTYSNFMAQYRK